MNILPFFKLANTDWIIYLCRHHYIILKWPFFFSALVFFFTTCLVFPQAGLCLLQAFMNNNKEKESKRSCVIDFMRKGGFAKLISTNVQGLFTEGYWICFCFF